MSMEFRELMYAVDVHLFHHCINDYNQKYLVMLLTNETEEYSSYLYVQEHFVHVSISYFTF